MCQNKFTALVDDLKSGAVNLTIIQDAVRVWVRDRPQTPRETVDLLCGSGDSSSGLIAAHFQLLGEIIGSMELAARRARE